MVNGVLPAWGTDRFASNFTLDFLYLLCTLKWKMKALTQVLISKLIQALRNFHCDTGFIMCSSSSCHIW